MQHHRRENGQHLGEGVREGIGNNLSNILKIVGVNLGPQPASGQNRVYG
jgi:hypothetical protein